MKVAEITAGSSLKQAQGASEKHDAVTVQRSQAKPSDKVDFSEKSRRAAATEVPSEASPERLAQLKSLIESGNYHVPAREVAAKMIASASRA